MNWWIILLCLLVAALVFGLITVFNRVGDWAKILFCICFMSIVFGLEIPLCIVTDNIEEKYDWYMETRLKYAESEGIEKMYLEMNDVMAYNLWYEKNNEDLENPWSFKSAAGCEFDYIKVGD